MNRLTRKDIYQEGYELESCGCQGDYMPINDNSPDIIDKLGILEDIEEDIGCSIDVLWKIRNQEFVYVDGVGKCIVVSIHIEPRTTTHIEYYNPITKDNRLLYVSDYKEEFWIKEDKSE